MMSSGRRRVGSFANLDEVEASGILSDVLREHNVFLGGSSIGKGFKTAARYHMRKAIQRQCNDDDDDNTNVNTRDLEPLIQQDPSAILEEPFYVVDLGVIVSQVYQWRKYFPRVEPFYAVKCNPDPVVVKTMAILGCNFDCASKTEMALVQELTADLPRTPEIIYANPTKARAHIVQAICRGVRLMTFDNVSEVQKCAMISKKIQLILRIVTDDRGSQCRLSSKFGAPRIRWRNLLRAAKQFGLQVVGVSFHVGSGCRDASRYAAALKDARLIFDVARKEFGFDLKILDIGGGFPGETHSVWNPADLDESDDEGDDEIEEKEGKEVASDASVSNNRHGEPRFMFFNDIAGEVGPMIDKFFPPEEGVRVIGEPGRFFVAAAATLVASIVSTRSNEVDDKFVPAAFDDKEEATKVDAMTREDENNIIRQKCTGTAEEDIKDGVLDTIVEELNDYSKLFAKQELVQQEADVYNDALDLYTEDIDTAADLLGPPDALQKVRQVHTVEGMTKGLLDSSYPSGLLTLAAAGEAAIKGMVLQAVADSAPFQDDYAYYINDGVYGAFNNIMFDHASVRPRVLRKVVGVDGITTNVEDGFIKLNPFEDKQEGQDKLLYSSTVFGPTCDSIDVIARSVLLPKLKVGDWLYFQNMGAYTMAAASSFNGFSPTEIMYVCSVQREFFESLIAGPDSSRVEPAKFVEGEGEEKKESL